MLEKISCPKCQHSIEVSKILFEKLQKDFIDRENRLKTTFRAELEKRVSAQKEESMKLANQKAKEEFSEQFKQLEENNSELKKKFELQMNTEMNLRKKVSEMEDMSMKLKLENQKQLELQKIELEKQLKDNLLKEKEILELQMKSRFQSEIDQEKERTRLEQQKTKQMENDILSLKRKLEQGSMQLQGDASENALKNWLNEWFPSDEITDVPTGIKGADLIQTVFDQKYQEVGKIVFESKNTKEWSNAWIGKLKHDQGLVKADIAVLVTKTLPKDVENFTLVDGIFVVAFNHLKPLVSALRFHLDNAYRLSNSMDNRDEKVQFLYAYLSGPQFKTRIENIIFAFNSLKEGLDSEKRAMQRIWARREKEIEKVIDNTSGLYGDMQGIIGGSIAKIDYLELE